MNTTFTITIRGVSKDLTFKVIHEVNFANFKRFRIVAGNGELQFEKHMPRERDAYWKVIGRQPQTHAGQLQLEAMKAELEKWMKRKPG